MISLVDVLLFFCFISFLLYLYFKYKFNYWKSLGVPHIKPSIPLGNIQGGKRRVHSSQLFKKFYDELKKKGKFVGIYFFTKPVILLTDLDFVKTVLIRDFQYFHNRGIYFNVKDDPLSGHLVNIEGEYWKKLREKITPTFTSGKMRLMLPTILEVATRFEIQMTKTIEENSEPEIKDILARFTTDIIGSCAFGIECNSIEDKNSKFLEMGLKVFQQPRNAFFKQIISLVYPEFARKMGVKTIREDVAEFFMKIVKDVIEYREKNEVKRNDFMQLLLQLKNDGELADEGDSTSRLKLGRLTVEEVAAQAFVFFLAGFETSSTTMMFCLHELSLNQDIQEKARKNVQEVLARHGGKITYEALSEMTYLEQCINEALRKFPPAANIVRTVTKDYNVPDSTVVFKKDQTVLISVYAIHHDPEIYENPEEFIPERFSQEEASKRHPMAFLPFGEGPRICIGMRFGMTETKVGLATLLSKFKFHKSDKTEVPLAFSKTNLILSPEGGLFLRIEKI
ncbi:CLUMA_CG016319, isoform A [Clunio marinus]|uniref:CLUMA_CG016319, isoform A n=1 Tax=Clunio marinus TaxID=568069 RepID=A0A1J1IUD5_9DIPT|nr:CLUMA_CG016319, isoform A [Clunio marinus]